ncbi:Ig-like domain-containing protein, partial [Limnohabitans sp. 2KL-51]|uniref:Ig-like domain-containing protein n=1 Tax=Limnohabitans sp. 2KL-51 TaxID=1977911 RepID=UPI000DD20CEA
MDSYLLQLGEYKDEPLSLKGPELLAAQVLVDVLKQSDAQAVFQKTLSSQALLSQLPGSEPLNSPQSVAAYLERAQQVALGTPEVKVLLENIGQSPDLMQAVAVLGAERSRIVLAQELDLPDAAQATLSNPAHPLTVAAQNALQSQWTQDLGEYASYQIFDNFTPLTGGTNPLWRTGAVVPLAPVDTNASSDAFRNTSSGTVTPTATPTSSNNTSTTMPNIAITSSRTELQLNETALISFSLSEASTSFSREDVTVIGGALSNWQGSGSNYSATFTPSSGASSAAVFVDSQRFSNASGVMNQDGQDTNNTVSMRIGTATNTSPTVNNSPATNTDTANTGSNASNSNSNTNVSASLAPTVMITSSQSSLAVGQSTTIEFMLSEASTNFTMGDVTVTGGTLSNFQGSGDRYTATLTATQPGFVISPSTPSASVKVLANTFSNAQGVYNTVGSNTPVVAVTNQAAVPQTPQTPAPESNNTTTTTTTTTTTAADTTPPSVIVTSNTYDLSTGQTATMTFTLSEASTTFTRDDVTVIGGGLSNWQGSGTTYTATFTPTAGATSAAVFIDSDRFTDATGLANKDGGESNNVVSLSMGCGVTSAAADPCGCPPASGGDRNTTVDTTPPTIAITSNKSLLGATESALITFTLSEASTNFTMADVTVVGGRLTQWQGSGSSYSAIFVPDAGVTNAAIYVDSSRFSDATGNQNMDGADANNAVALRLACGCGTGNNNGNNTGDTSTYVGITSPGQGGTAGVITGSGEPGAVVTVRDVNNNIIGSTTVSATGAWSLTPTGPVATGTISASARDTNGNTANATGSNGSGGGDRNNSSFSTIRMDAASDTGQDT